MTNKILAIIPARSGSKGIPSKNTRLFCGKPLLYYTIRLAYKSGIFERIIVDTESEEIAAFAQKFGAEVPYLRPKRLATDQAEIADAVLLLLEKLRKDGYGPEIISLLQATSPLRKVEDILNCYTLLQKPGVESVATVCESHQRFYHIDHRGKLILVNRDSEKFTNRQQISKGYVLNGCIVYMIKAEAFLKHKRFVYGKTHAVICPKWRSVDLDAIEDWVQAETLYKNKDLIDKKIGSFK